MRQAKKCFDILCDKYYINDTDFISIKYMRVDSETNV